MTISTPSAPIIARPTPKRTPSVRPVPKPKPRPQPTPLATGRIAQALAAAEGDLFTDIAADREAADALGVSRQIDRRRDPLVRRMTQLFMLIRADLNCPAHLRDFAVMGEAAGREAIRLDRTIGEHDIRAAAHVELSAQAGRRVVAAHETLLTGREVTVELPFPLDGVLAPAIRGAEREQP